MSYKNEELIESFTRIKSILSQEKYVRDKEELDFVYNTIKNYKFVSHIMDIYGTKRIEQLFQIIMYKEYRKKSFVFKVGKVLNYFYNR